MLSSVSAAAELPPLHSGQAELLVRNNGILLRWKSQKVWEQARPVQLELVDSADKSSWIRLPYDSAKAIRGGIRCACTVKSPNGTSFHFQDTYLVHGRSAFMLTRTVTVEDPSPDDKAFSTRFSLERPGNDLADYDILAPGVWYGKNEHVPRHAFGGDYSDRLFYIREDRLAAPFAMAMEHGSGMTLSLGHYSPDAQTFQGEDFLARLVDDRMQFGSLGLERLGSGVGVGFLFPGSEGEKTYISGGSVEKRWALRSHPVKAGISHSYSLIIKVDEQPRFPDAVRSTWRFFFDQMRPQVVKADLKKVYGDGVDLLEKYAKFRAGAPGFPFDIRMDGKAGMYSYQMGFVGAQLPCAYLLFRDGLLNQRSKHMVMGEAIINFWVKESYDGAEGPDALPHTWYQTRIDGPGPHWGVMANERFWRDEPVHDQVFMRTLSEGHLGMLRAWELANKHGIERPEWLRYVRRFGDWLANHQNPDGSFYRKYDVKGSPLQPTKENTTHPIPFLIELYRATGDKTYLKTALSAGEYSLGNIHKPACYVGGTPDNPNVTDKEAAQLALDAFLALYDVTQDRKWLDAARQAADFTETWVYIWDIPMPLGSKGLEVFDRIDTTGLSLVATGHSYADYADSMSAYSFLRLAKLTGDKHYHDMGMILLHNTKQLLDTDGSKGYAHPGLQVEGIGLSVLRGSGPRVWLAWITFDQLDSIVRLEDEGELN